VTRSVGKGSRLRRAKLGHSVANIDTTRAPHKIRVAIFMLTDRGDDQSKIRTIDCFYAILSHQQ
jgi:hypothetical protein